MIFGLAFVASSILIPMSVYAQEPGVRYISFNSMQAGNHDIFIIDAQGEHFQRLTDEGNFNATPAWSPDGKNCFLFHPRSKG